MIKTMIDRLTPEANARLERYLRQVRYALEGCASVNADEVERDIREHIDNALPAEHETVSLWELNAVLDRLGKPTQWVPQHEQSAWRSFLMRMRTGGEDWRLAYLAFGLLVLGFLFLHLAWILLPASYLVARAALAAARSEGEDLGPQKWLIYPPLAVAFPVLFGLLLFGPPILAGGLAYEIYGHYMLESRIHRPDFAEVMRNEEVAWPLAAMTVAAGIWWLLLGIVLSVWPRLFNTVVGPVNFQRKHGRYIIYAGLAAGGACVVALALWLWRQPPG